MRISTLSVACLALFGSLALASAQSAPPAKSAIVVQPANPARPNCSENPYDPTFQMGGCGGGEAVACACPSGK